MNTVVYYPYLWPSPEWVRLAALCWDKVYLVGRRIGFGIALPEPVATFDAALGGLFDTSLVVDDLLDDELMSQFERWIDANASRLRDEMTSDPQQLFRIYKGKLSRSMAPTEKPLLDWLKGRGLARIDDEHVYQDMQDVVVYLPRDLGFHYLGLAAAKAATLGNRDLAADRSEFTDVIFHDARMTRGAVATSTLEAHLPQDFERLDVAQLAEIRSDLKMMRLKYQSAVNDLVAQFSSVASEGELLNLAKAITEIAEDKVHETEATYKRARLKTVVEGFGVTLTPPAVATTLASTLGIGIFGPAGVAMALSLFGVRALLSRADAKATKAASPWSYVLEVASRTKPGPRRQTEIVRYDDLPQTA